MAIESHCDDVLPDSVSAFALTSVSPQFGVASEPDERKVDSDVQNTGKNGELLRFFFGIQNTLLSDGAQTGGAVVSQVWQPEHQRLTYCLNVIIACHCNAHATETKHLAIFMFARI